MPRKKMLEEKIKTSFNVSPEAARLLEALAQKLQVSKSAVFEAAIREKARKEKVEG
jgi:predicted transcriptional regulator